MLPAPGLYALFCALGVSAWLAINAVFQELPILAATQPEGWAIGAHLSATIQLANVFVLVEAYAVRRFQLSQVWVTYLLLLLGILSSLLLASSWSTVVVVFGAPRSLPLLLLTFLAGAVDCTTSVVYWPLVAAFADEYTAALGVGEALSGTVVGALGLLQRPARRPPAFGAGPFFGCIAGITAVSLLAFGLIHRFHLRGAEGPGDQTEALCEEGHDEEPKEDNLAWPLLARPLAAMAVINFLQNGVAPALLSYAFLKYPRGNAWLAWYLAASMAITPLPPAAAAWVRVPNVEGPLLVVIALMAYMTWVSAAKKPPFSSSEVGGQVMMAVLLVAQVFMMYLKTFLFFKLKTVVAPVHHARVYKYGGYAIQLGSCLGAFTALLLVSVFDVFPQ